MKEIKIYSLEGCNNCKEVTAAIDELVAGKGINVIKKFCGSNDSACDAIEDGLGTSTYPIIYLSSFDYFKEQFNTSNGMLYICNNYNELNRAFMFSADITAAGILNKSSMIELLKQIVK